MNQLKTIVILNLFNYPIDKAETENYKRGGKKMNSSEEFAGIHLKVMTEISKKALEVMQEILKALILRSTQNNKIQAGKTNLANLVKSGEQIKFSEIDKADIKPLMKLARKYKVPVAIIKNGNLYKASFKESDLSRVSEMIKDMH